MYALYEGLVLSPADVLYSPLPMYHTAAGLMVTGAAMAEGLSSVSRSGESVTLPDIIIRPPYFRKKFSASQFWRDCYNNNVTVG